jgi:Zn ribbon nucleic-acid-binding protein
MAGSVSSDPPICSNCGHRAQLSHLDDDGVPHWGCAECGRRLTRLAIKTMGGNVWRRLVRNARKYRKEAACQGPQNVPVVTIATPTPEA